MHNCVCVKLVLALAVWLSLAHVAQGGDISSISDLTALRPDSADEFVPNTEVLVPQGNYTDFAQPSQPVATVGIWGPNYTQIDQTGLSNQAAVVQNAGRLNVNQSGLSNNAAVDSRLFVH
jgi:hypothetical protein